MSTSEPEPAPRPLLLALALLLFFASGAAGLVYEVSWARQFGNTFGHTVHTAAVVLFSYLGGLAIGYWLAGRWAVRCRPLTAYGGMELLAAAWVCLVPTLLVLVGQTPLGGLDPGPGHLWTGLRVLGCFLLLLPATAALGATWPLIAAFLSPRWLSWGYALNTAGALVGSLLATVWLLPAVGVRAASFTAAAVSAGCGLAALALGRGLCAAPGVPEDALETPAPAGAPARRWLALVTASGFALLALQVLYLRLFSLVFHNSTYTFGAVVSVFLLALALGTAAAALIGARLAPATLAAAACGTGALAIALSVGLFVRLTDFQYFTAGSTFAAYLLAALGLVAAVVLPPVTALGMVLPAAWRALPARVAGCTAASTLAGAAGSLAASFALLPVLGLWGSFALLGGLYFAASSWVLLRRRALLPWLLLAAAGVVVADWDGTVLRRASSLLPGDTLLRRWEGPYGWIDVVAAPDQSLAIRQNLHYAFGSSKNSVRRDYRQGHLPLLLHGRPVDVAYLGLGTGQTAAAALSHPQLEQIVVVELIPEAVEAARLLHASNLGLVDHPRVTLQVEDARRYLQGTQRRFDVIVADLFVPWESQTGYLYTVEHFQAAQRALKPGGLFCQWLPLYQLGPADFELIADSFATVFPHTTLWWAEQHGSVAVLGLVGSQTPLDLARAAAARAALAQRDPRVPLDPHLGSDPALAALRVGQWRVRRPDWLNTDERPRVEFSAPISHADNRKLRGRMLREYLAAVLSQLPK